MHYTVKKKTIEKLENPDTVSGRPPHELPNTGAVNYVSGDLIQNIISHNTIYSSEINANTSTGK